MKQFQLTSSLIPLSLMALSAGSVAQETISSSPLGRPHGGQTINGFGTYRSPDGSLRIDGTTPYKYYHGASSLLIDYGFSFDPITGTWSIEKPIGNLHNALPLPMDAPHETISVELKVADQVARNRTSVSIQAEAAYATVQAYASYASFRDAMIQENSLVLNVRWGMRWQDILAEQFSDAWSYGPDAMEIFAMPESDRAQQWITDFGRYVAIGYRPEAYVDFRLVLRASSTAQQRGEFIELATSYSGASFQGAAEAVYHSLAKSEFIELNIDALGVSTASIQGLIPGSASALDEPHEREAFMETLRQLMLTATPTPSGVILASGSSLIQAPELQNPSLDPVIIGPAVVEVQEDVDTLLRTERYLGSPEIETFMAVHGMWQGLDERRDALLDGIVGIWDALQVVYGSPTAANRAVLNSAIDQAEASRIALLTWEDMFAGFAAGLQSLSLEYVDYLEESATPESGAGFWWKPFEIDVRNTALFDADILGEIGRSLRVFENSPGFGSAIERTVANGGIRNLTFVGNPSQGDDKLYTARVRFEVANFSSNIGEIFEFTDGLQRIHVLGICNDFLGEYVPCP